MASVNSLFWAFAHFFGWDMTNLLDLFEVNDMVALLWYTTEGCSAAATEKSKVSASGVTFDLPFSKKETLSKVCESEVENFSLATNCAVIRCSRLSSGDEA